MAKKENYSKDGKTKFTNFGSGKDRVTIAERTDKKGKPTPFDQKKKLK
jgi:hypothetical protein